MSSSQQIRPAATISWPVSDAAPPEREQRAPATPAVDVDVLESLGPPPSMPALWAFREATAPSAPPWLDAPEPPRTATPPPPYPSAERPAEASGSRAAVPPSEKRPEPSAERDVRASEPAGSTVQAALHAPRPPPFLRLSRSSRGEARQHMLELRAQGMLALRAGDGALAQALFDGIAASAGKLHVDLQEVLSDGSTQDPFAAVLRGERVGEALHSRLLELLTTCARGRAFYRSFEPPYAGLLAQRVQAEAAPLLARLLHADTTDAALDADPVADLLRLPAWLGAVATIWFGACGPDLTALLPSSQNLVYVAHMRGLTHWRDVLAAACPQMRRSFASELAEALAQAWQEGNTARQSDALAQLAALPAHEAALCIPAGHRDDIEAMLARLGCYSFGRLFGTMNFIAPPQTAPLWTAVLRQYGIGLAAVSARPFTNRVTVHDLRAGAVVADDLAESTAEYFIQAGLGAAVIASMRPSQRRRLVPLLRRMLLDDAQRASALQVLLELAATRPDVGPDLLMLVVEPRVAAMLGDTLCAWMRKEGAGAAASADATPLGA